MIIIVQFLSKTKWVLKAAQIRRPRSTGHHL
jgi:hypothetical protein